MAEDTLTLPEQTISRLAQYIRIGKKMHHVTVHSNGRCLVRAGAVRRFRLPVIGNKEIRVSVQVEAGQAVLVFGVRERNRVVRIVKADGRQCKCIYFYSRKIAGMAASTGISRFRFADRGEWLKDGSFRIVLNLGVVKDLHTILQEYKLNSHGKTN